MKECLFVHVTYVLPKFSIATPVLTDLTSSYTWSAVHDVLVRILLHCRTTSHCWPGGRTRTQRAWLNCTTRRLFGTTTHNPMCSTSTAESLRRPSRISKLFMTMTVSPSKLFNIKYEVTKCNFVYKYLLIWILLKGPKFLQHTEKKS